LMAYFHWCLPMDTMREYFVYKAHRNLLKKKIVSVFLFVFINFLVVCSISLDLNYLFKIIWSPIWQFHHWIIEILKLCNLYIAIFFFFCKIHCLKKMGASNLILWDNCINFHIYSSNHIDNGQSKNIIFFQ